MYAEHHNPELVMLILTRRTDETLIIGKEANIEITILGIKGNQVKIGISAPGDVPIHRQEIYQKIQDEVKEPTEK